MFSRKKAFFTIFLTAILVVAFMLAAMNANRLIFADKMRSRDANKLEAIARVLEELSSSLSETETKAVDQYEVKAAITATALESVISDGTDDAAASYGSGAGAVVKIENGRITASGSVSQDLGLTASLFETEKGVFAAPANSSTLVVYCRIGGTPYYYLDWYENTDLTELVKSTVNLSGTLEEAEAAYGSRIVLVRKESEENVSGSGMAVLYCNKDLPAYKDTNEMGLTVEEIEQSVGKPPQNLDLKGVRYMYSVGEVPSLNGYAILLVPETDIMRQTLDQIGGLVSILILILAGMVGTGLSLYGYAIKNMRTAGSDNRYEPSYIRKVVALYGMTGLLFMGIGSAYLYSLNGLHKASISGNDALEMLEKRIILNINQDSYGAKNTIDSYIGYGGHISELLDRYPQLRDVRPLKDLAECIGASSITLYDNSGKEIVSSGGYIDMYLGTGAESTTYDFRRILKGVPFIIHEAETDETTGMTEVRIGIRMKDAGAPGKYGVMLISLDPAVIEQATTDEIESALHNMSEEETMLWIAENGTGTILASSNSAMTGRDIYSIGMGENDLKEGLMNSIFMENGRYFVISSLLDDPVIAEGAERFDNSVAYYAMSRKATNYGVFYSVANCCFVYVVIYAFLAWFILHDYTEEFYEECRNRKKPEETAEAARGDKKEGLLRSLWNHYFGPGSYWDTRRPEQKGFIVMQFFLAFFLLQQIPLLTKIGRSQDSLYYYILKGFWDRGINLFAVARIMILAGEMILLVIVLNFLLRFVGMQMGAKGLTVFKLLMSVIKYLAFASFIGLSLYYLGVDKTTLLAAFSILSLAISLGSQNFIADIIAGISIILEGEFSVGDDVVIGSYTGKVLEVSVRTTKLLCAGNDVMVIGNKEIKTVLNKSRRNTVYIFSISIRSDYPIDVIRELLERELPVIGAKNNMILRGPVFHGITKIEEGKMTLAIETECRQADLYRTKLYLNSELQKLFAKNGIRI